MFRYVVALLLFAWAGVMRADDPAPIWKAELREKNQTIAPVDAVAFSRDGPLILARAQQSWTGARGKASIVIWESDSKKEAGRITVDITDLQTPGPVIAANGPKDWLAVDGRSIVRVSLEKDKLVKADRERGSAVWTIADSEFFAANANESEATLTWVREIDPGTPGANRFRGAGMLKKHPDDWPITALAIDRTGKKAAAARYRPEGREVQLALDWMERDGVLSIRRRSEAEARETGRMSCLVFSADGKFLATGGDDGIVRIWDTLNAPESFWVPQSWVEVTKMSISALAFHPGGKHLAFSTTNGGKSKARFGMIDVATGKVVRQWDVPSGLGSLAFSPDGSLLLTGNHLGTVELWDVNAILGLVKK